jgi:hypothetical protein
VGASVTLVTPAVAVEPGQTAAIAVKVRNTGSVVDEFALDVLGDAAAWATVEPPSMNLFPGAEGEAKAVFRPPRLASTPAGLVPFGLRARSREDPAGSAVEEGNVTVGAFSDPYAELVPRTSRGSGGGSHDVAVDNRGNARLSAEIEAIDTDQQLRFDVKPPAVVVDPGMAAFAKVRVSPAKRFWRGQPKTRPFQMFIRPEGGAPIQLDGTLLQESILPPWFLKALLLLVAAIIALVLLWLLVLKPTVQGLATEAISSPLASLKDDVNTALGAAGLPTMPAGGGSTSAPPSSAPPPSTEPGTSNPPSAPPSVTPSPGVIIAGLGAPVDGTLDDTTRTVTFKNVAFLTDFLLSNPSAKDGGLVLARINASKTDVLMRLRLENFRDYDVHLVTPIVLAAGDTLAISLSCEGGGVCDPSVFYSGYLRP